MTYKNLIIKISDACGLRRADVRTVLDAMIGNIIFVKRCKRAKEYS